MLAAALGLRCRPRAPQQRQYTCMQRQQPTLAVAPAAQEHCNRVPSRLPAAKRQAQLPPAGCVEVEAAGGAGRRRRCNALQTTVSQQPSLHPSGMQQASASAGQAGAEAHLGITGVQPAVHAAGMPRADEPCAAVDEDQGRQQRDPQRRAAIAARHLSLWGCPHGRVRFPSVITGGGAASGTAPTAGRQGGRTGGGGFKHRPSLPSLPARQTAA